MAIDRAQVRHVARLARLALSPEEEERLATQLGHVLDYIERPAGGGRLLGCAAQLRGGRGRRAAAARGRAAPDLPRETVLAQAPQADGRAFVVPRIIE